MENKFELAFTDEAREYLKSNGFSNFVLPCKGLPTLPVIGDTMWLDSTDKTLLFTVTDRTFKFTPLGVVSIELELGLLGPASDR